MKNRVFTAVVSALVWALGTGTYAAESSTAQAYEAVSAAVRPAMEKHHIPGMAVALVLGQATYVFNYGVADVDKQTPVSDATMFEVGSISKTFTATLATYAETVGALHLSDAVE
ncbi:MAG: serine hydrolase, partial [Comamonas sp.]